ncbi:beta-lactamase-like protein [Lasiosphaeria hispida]|uniref:Beta-lactamase-like protein n=1 Tax=Lasiosphaeria hispida TaxID=260671 RepID=A0AAJ0HLR0_9PEZI|nr:beta-lactamase-like protein [Lasiosphaeria hispida]
MASHSVAFAIPLPQSTRSEILEWRFPKPYHNYVLTGRSRAAWHTSFVIPQLNLLLDAGLCVNKLRPKHIFLTHGHSDHTLVAPAFGKTDDPPDVYCPAEMANAFINFCFARTLLNLGGLMTSVEGDLDDGEAPPPPPPPSPGGPPPKGDGRHITHGLAAGDSVPLRRLKNITATAFACDHTVPCLGYVFSQTTQKLKPAYASLSGAELKELRETQGVAITAAVTMPIFAFLGDTTAATLAAGPAWLAAGIPVVITECSFLYEEHRAQAVKTKHTLWADLEVVVRRWPRTTFVLTHFSMRYSGDEIKDFFKKLIDPPANILVWADGEGGG